MTPEEIEQIKRESFKRLSEGKSHGVQYKTVKGEWADSFYREDGSAEVSWRAPNEYRIRPDTVNVFGMELPKPNKEFVINFNPMFDHGHQASEWGQFFDACLSGEYAQNPKKKVTVEDVEREVKAYYESTPQFIAKKIIDLFESANNENK